MNYEFLLEMYNDNIISFAKECLGINMEVMVKEVCIEKIEIIDDGECRKNGGFAFDKDTNLMKMRIAMDNPEILRSFVHELTHYSQFKNKGFALNNSREKLIQRQREVYLDAKYPHKNVNVRRRYYYSSDIEVDARLAAVYFKYSFIGITEADIDYLYGYGYASPYVILGFINKLPEGNFKEYLLSHHLDRQLEWEIDSYK